MMRHYLMILLVSFAMWACDAEADLQEKTKQSTAVHPEDEKVIEMMEFLEIMDILNDPDKIGMLKDLNVLVEED